MEENNKTRLSEAIKSVFDGVETLAKTTNVVGEPYSVGDTIIVPFIEANLGFGIGTFNESNDGGGVALKVSPFACLVIKGDNVRLINIKNNDPVSKALDMIPELIEKFEHSDNVSEKTRKSIQNLKDEEIVIVNPEKRADNKKKK